MNILNIWQDHPALPMRGNLRWLQYSIEKEKGASKLLIIEHMHVLNHSIMLLVMEVFKQKVLS